MVSPLLPWEVIERVISHSGDDPYSLHNFSLTCRQLRPRALCLLVSDLHLESRVDIFNFCDFVKAKPHLKRLVHSVVVDLNDFAPFPLLDILPNLFQLTFTGTQVQHDEDILGTSAQFEIVTLNCATLMCCKYLGAHIQALHLSDLSFSTYLEFTRVLLTFKNIRHLVCSKVAIMMEGNQTHLDVLERRLSERMHLRSVDIIGFDDELHDTSLDRTPSVAALLLKTGLVQATVENLAVQACRCQEFSNLFGWPRLRALRLPFKFTTLRDIGDIIEFLTQFSPLQLQDVALELVNDPKETITSMLSREGVSASCQELEQTLLRFSGPRIAYLVGQLRPGRNSLWTQELGKWFPELFQRGMLSITPRRVIPTVGHDGAIWDLSASPDGKWVATGSEDSTIILWNTTNATISRQWVAHRDYKPVTSLAFSPDSQRLVSSGRDSEVKVWDLAEGSREVTTLELGHARPVTSCAWSPSGDVIASSSEDKTIRLWDARTFRQLHIFEHKECNIRFIEFSPDGRWLVSKCPPICEYQIFHIASRTLHKTLRNLQPHDSEDDPEMWPGTTPSIRRLLPAQIVAASTFNPWSTHLAIASKHDVVQILDIDTGEEISVLRGAGVTRHVAFSPDGTLLLTISTEGTVRIWDAYAGIEFFALAGHKKGVVQACFAPCGKYVASASLDGTVRLWSTRDGSCLATLRDHKTSRVHYVAFSTDGKTLWSGDESGTVIMRRVCDILSADEQALEYIHNMLPRLCL